MKLHPELLSIVGIVAIGYGLWLERPSLTFLFCGALALVLGVWSLRQKRSSP